MIPGHRQHAYTLIEVLVALAILATIAVLAYSGLSRASRARADLERRGDQFAQIQMTLTILERDITHARYRPVRTGPDQVAPAFEAKGSGTAWQMEFSSVASSLDGDPARVRIERVAWLRQGATMIRRSWAFADRTALTPAYDQALLQGISLSRFEYLDRKRQWHGVWPSPEAPKERDELPLAVRAKVIVEGWGEITRIIPLRAA